MSDLHVHQYVSLPRGASVRVALPDGRTIEVRSTGVVYADDVEGINYAHFDFNEPLNPLKSLKPPLSATSPAVNHGWGRVAGTD